MLRLRGCACKNAVILTRKGETPLVKHDFDIGEKKLTLYAAAEANRPLVVIHTFDGDGGNIWAKIQALGQDFQGKAAANDFNLLVVYIPDWDHAMTPWSASPLSKKDAPFTGGADQHLEWLREDVLPKAQDLIEGTPIHTGIAGYSLAGLLALYALYQCDVFDRAACMSASFWFPGFVDFVRHHDLGTVPNRLYFSLGDKEAKTRHPLLKTVETCTEAMVEHFKGLGVDVIFEMNPGNHFTDVEQRIAKGIMAII